MAEKQQADPVLSKVRRWVKPQHQPTSQECKLLSPDEKFYVDCFEHLQPDSDGLLIRQLIKYMYEKDCRIALPENLQERVLASFHGVATRERSAFDNRSPLPGCAASALMHATTDATSIPIPLDPGDLSQELLELLVGPVTNLQEMIRDLPHQNGYLPDQGEQVLPEPR